MKTSFFIQFKAANECRMGRLCILMIIFFSLSKVSQVVSLLTLSVNCYVANVKGLDYLKENMTRYFQVAIEQFEEIADISFELDSECCELTKYT